MFTARFPPVLFNPVAYLSGSIQTSDSSSPTAKLRSAWQDEPRAAPTDSAMRVVTDFTWEQPVTIAGDRSIDDAHREMMVAGVHALLVAEGDMVIGLITSHATQGERLAQLLFALNELQPDEIAVGHVMTPWDRVPTLDWQFLRVARVADVARIFERTGATHLVIVEHGEQGGTFVRGLISRARLERQLGSSIHQ